MSSMGSGSKRALEPSSPVSTQPMPPAPTSPRHANMKQPTPRTANFSALLCFSSAGGGGAGGVGPRATGPWATGPLATGPCAAGAGGGGAGARGGGGAGARGAAARGAAGCARRGALGARGGSRGGVGALWLRMGVGPSSSSGCQPPERARGCSSSSSQSSSSSSWSIAAMRSRLHIWVDSPFDDGAWRWAGLNCPVLPRGNGERMSEGPPRSSRSRSRRGAASPPARRTARGAHWARSLPGHCSATVASTLAASSASGRSPRS